MTRSATKTAQNVDGGGKTTGPATKMGKNVDVTESIGGRFLQNRGKMRNFEDSKKKV